MLTVVVTGGRDYTDAAMVNKTLDRLHAAHGVTLLVEGGATGADSLARAWAKAHKIPFKTVKADWDKLGPKAGPVRNGQMLERYKPDIVVAFPGNAGTADCVSQARMKDIYCWGPGLAGALELIKQQQRKRKTSQTDAFDP